MIDKLDIYIVAGTALFMSFAFGVLALWLKRYPSVETLGAVATLFNTKGGIILVLWFAWWLTLLITIAFGTWVIVSGVDQRCRAGLSWIAPSGLDFKCFVPLVAPKTSSHAH